MNCCFPLPEGWQADFYLRADLERSFEDLKSLGGAYGYFVEAVRGHIRTLQLKYDDARVHLDRASTQLAGSPLSSRESHPGSFATRLLVEIFRFDLALATDAPDPAAELSNLSAYEDLSIQSWELASVLALHRSCEAQLHLRRGRPEPAARIYGRLLSEDPTQTQPAVSVPECPARANRGPRYVDWSDASAAYSLNLAACQHGLGLLESAERTLENAEFSSALINGALNKARASAILSALHDFLGETKRADQWLSFLWALDCPPRTKRLFVERAQRIYERCTEQSRLVGF